MMALHAHSMEWVWVVFSLLSHIFSIRSLVDAVKDEAFLSATGKNGGRRLTADSNTRHELFKLLMSFVMMIAACSSLFLVPPPPAFQERPQMSVIIVACIILSLIMGTDSIFERHVRKTLAQYGEDDKPVDPVTGTETVKQAGGLGVTSTAVTEVSPPKEPPRVTEG